MLLAITTTRAPATDLGWLLHKHPARVQTFELAFGAAHVFYPVAQDERCTAVLLLDVDPVGLVRRRGGPPGDGLALQQYVNDRPYVASSLLSVAIAQVYGSALGGRCREKPELVAARLPLEVRIAAVRSRGGEGLLARLFEPLGYELGLRRYPLDERFPEWGESNYFSVKLRAECRLQDLLGHLYVLLPVLDDEKHYWVGEDELAKLLRKGEGWLAGHPERRLIAQRYLKHQRYLTRAALARLADEDHPDPDGEQAAYERAEAALEATLADRGDAQKPASAEPPSRGPTLGTQRLAAVLAALRAAGARSVIDLGCGGGKLLRHLLADARFERIVGLDVSSRALDAAADRLRLERLPPPKRARIELLHGSLVYRDQRLRGFDAAACVEVIEHLDPPRLAALERVLFEFARPRTVVITTPNREYNVRFATLPAGRLRHGDHRFEWTRAEFESWAGRVAERFGYRVRFQPIGPPDDEVGSPTQMAVFELTAEDG